jgi:hypothetical protein
VAPTIFRWINCGSQNSNSNVRFWYHANFHSVAIAIKRSIWWKRLANDTTHLYVLQHAPTFCYEKTMRILQLQHFLYLWWSLYCLQTKANMLVWSTFLIFQRKKPSQNKGKYVGLVMSLSIQDMHCRRAIGHQSVSEFILRTKRS